MKGQNLAKKIREGDKKSLAKGITLVCSHLDQDKEESKSLLTEILKFKKDSYRIGVSGIGGVGKSTFIGVLGKYILGLNEKTKVAALTIDPSSPKAGGSILGDGVRMGEFSSEERSFVRSVANKGVSGGVSPQAQEIVYLLEAAGYDFILIESVGSGQSDTSIASLCDVFVNLQMPASGDAIQAIKKGSSELADFVVVHKNDGVLKTEAEKTKVFYQQAQGLQKITREQTFPRLILVSSLEKKGFKELWEYLLKKKKEDLQKGSLYKKREEQLEGLFEEQLSYVFKEVVFSKDSFSKKLRDSKKSLREKTSTPLLEARRIVESFLES